MQLKKMYLHSYSFFIFAEAFFSFCRAVLVGRTSSFLLLTLPRVAPVADVVTSVAAMHGAIMVVAVTAAAVVVAATAALAAVDETGVVVTSTTALATVADATVGVTAASALKASADAVRLLVERAIDISVAAVDSALS
jgi:hypothetical protein